MPAADSANFKQYQFYNSTLRGWFIGFGVGLPALVLSQKHLYEKLQCHAWVGVLMVIAVGLQIAGAFINKYTNYFEYDVKETTNVYKFTKYRNAFSRVNDWMVIDIVLDLASAALFIVAGIATASYLL